MRPTVTIFLLLLATSLLATPQDRSKLSPEESRILALETAWNQAEEHKDAGALDQLLASTLAYTDYDGSFMNKGQFLASTKDPSVHPSQIIDEETHVQMYGNSAVVTGIYREKGTAKGKSYTRRGRFTDTWISQNGTWQCVASQSTLITH
jgi:ketosteroid isomerase-like protein